MREIGTYFFGAVLALGVDAGSLLWLTRIGFPLPVAVGLAFTSGLLIIYLVSIRFAFQERRFENVRLEFMVFLLIGLAGLLLTELSMWAFVVIMSVPVWAAKLATSGGVFFFNYLLRKKLLFSKR